jgi:chromosome segregation ATPase
VIATLEGLVSIIEELGKEIGQTHEQLEELKRAKLMVANHHSIVSDLQENYSQQIRTIYADHQKSLEATRTERDQLDQQIQALQQEKHEVRQRLAKCE